MPQDSGGLRRRQRIEPEKFDFARKDLELELTNGAIFDNKDAQRESLPAAFVFLVAHARMPASTRAVAARCVAAWEASML